MTIFQNLALYSILLSSLNGLAAIENNCEAQVDQYLKSIDLGTFKRPEGNGFIKGTDRYSEVEKTYNTANSKKVSSEKDIYISTEQDTKKFVEKLAPKLNDLKSKYATLALQDKAIFELKASVAAGNRTTLPRSKAESNALAILNANLSKLTFAREKMQIDLSNALSDIKRDATSNGFRANCSEESTQVCQIEPLTLNSSISEKIKATPSLNCFYQMKHDGLESFDPEMNIVYLVHTPEAKQRIRKQIDDLSIQLAQMESTLPELIQLAGLRRLANDFDGKDHSSKDIASSVMIEYRNKRTQSQKVHPDYFKLSDQLSKLVKKERMSICAITKSNGKIVALNMSNSESGTSESIACLGSSGNSDSSVSERPTSTPIEGPAAQ